MTGLRAKQKAQRRQLIEKAATALFVERSFNDTTIEDIAERALVSPATVYNYYGTKGELLLALVARGEEGIAEKVEDFTARVASDDPIDLIAAVIRSNVKDTLSHLSRELWGHVVAYISTTKDDAVAPKYLDTIADGLAAALENVLAEQIKQGKLKEGTDPQYVAYFLTRMERIHFLNHVYLHHQSVEEMHNNMRADTNFIMKFLVA